jgi:hypothetical protein
MAKKRSRKERLPRFVAVYEWEMVLPAYRLLSAYGRALLLEFRIAYNGHNNGGIVMSVRHAAKLLNCSKDTALKVIRELEEKGWIVKTSNGSFSQKTNKTASMWRITNQPVGLGVDTPATKEFARWSPPGKQSTVRKNRTTRPRKSHRVHNLGPNQPDRNHLNCPNSSDRHRSTSGSNGHMKSDTYNIAILETTPKNASHTRCDPVVSNSNELLDIPVFLDRRK